MSRVDEVKRQIQRLLERLAPKPKKLIPIPIPTKNKQ